ncbi:MAG TPA: hypothetical protein P5534_07095 [Candidatus Paceibacterota bacterium]|nr:hypothetical protein [Candidatus Paceibacterota bacterium]HRZ57969.1 hypothetical protein [Candidatus Paceibacterota bacterium]
MSWFFTAALMMVSTFSPTMSQVLLLRHSGVEVLCHVVSRRGIAKVKQAAAVAGG